MGLGRGTPTSSEHRVRAACEAAYVLNDAVGALLIPQHLAKLALKLHDAGGMSSKYAGPVRRLSMQGAIMGLYKVKEARDHLLAPWVFTTDELRQFGFPPVEEFVGDWSAFMTVRGQYVGHVVAKGAKGSPGRIISGKALGHALRRAGLWDAEPFLRRVERVLLPGIERTRDELFRKYPAARPFALKGYPGEVESAAETP